MPARRAVGQAERSGDVPAEATARTDVHAAKVALGERGPPWWTDGSPDINQRMAKNTCYADRYERLMRANAEPTA
jgi:hypothetical protein